jgi:ADP-heptose:LPS heptosyltransferase
MRILFISSNRLGDAILSTGLLDHLIRTHPDARITVACGPVAAGLFSRMPQLERLIVLTKQSHGRHWLPLWGMAVRRRWDLVVDIRGSALSWLVLTRRRAVMRPSTGPKVEQIARVLRLTPAPGPVVWFGAEDSARVAPFFDSGRPVVALAPTANWGPKIWPPDRFVTLFEKIRALLPDAQAAVIAGPGENEAALARPVLQAIPDAIDLAGRLTLPEIAAFLTRARLFVGNDSGLMHLAAASGVPTLGLFGPTNAAEYAPWGPRARTIVSPDATMAGVAVERVMKDIRGLLKPG